MARDAAIIKPTAASIFLCGRRFARKYIFFGIWFNYDITYTTSKLDHRCDAADLQSTEPPSHFEGQDIPPFAELRLPEAPDQANLRSIVMRDMGHALIHKWIINMKTFNILLNPIEISRFTLCNGQKS